jgi:hypothetical protein
MGVNVDCDDVFDIRELQLGHLRFPGWLDFRTFRIDYII